MPPPLPYNRGEESPNPIFLEVYKMYIREPLPIGKNHPRAAEPRGIYWGAFAPSIICR